MDLADAEREIPDAELVPLVKKGIQWASERLIRRHYSSARTLVFHMCEGIQTELGTVDPKNLRNIDELHPTQRD